MRFTLSETPVPSPPVLSVNERDLGFGAVVANESRKRLLNRDGTFNVRRTGLGLLASVSPYHTLLTMSWPAFLAVLTAAYVLANAFFGVLFLWCGPAALQGPGIPGPLGPFLKTFFFSVETFATIGYGHVSPLGLAANVLVTIESLVGLLGVALVTGVIFARFSRPTAKIRFSERAIIAPYRDITAFEFRIANERSNEILDLDAKVLLSRLEIKGESTTRQFYELALERRHSVFFPLAWTIVHPITEDSPLYGVTHEELLRTDAEFLILLSGIDETFSQGVHARTSYRASEVSWNVRFRNVFNPRRDDGVLSINVGALHEVEPAGPPRAAAG